MSTWQTGRPEVVEAVQHAGSAARTTTRKGICPAALGSKDQQPAAFSPKTGLFYVPTNHVCMDYEPFKVSYTAGQPYVGATLSMYPAPGRQQPRQFHRLGRRHRQDRVVGSGALLGVVGRARHCRRRRLLRHARRLSEGRRHADAARSSTGSRPRRGSSATSTPTLMAASNTSPCCPASAAGPASAWRRALTKDTDGLGAVGAYKALANYTQLGGVLTVFGTALAERAVA